jgi:hypothetical protein
VGLLATADTVAEHDGVLAGLAEFGNIPHGSPPPPETYPSHDPRHLEELEKTFLPFSSLRGMQEQCKTREV